MTPDMWQRTTDAWHVTRDKWHVTHGGGLTLSQNFTSLALRAWDFYFLEDLEGKHQWLNYNAVCRTATATPGLLIIIQNIGQLQIGKENAFQQIIF